MDTTTKIIVSVLAVVVLVLLGLFAGLLTLPSQQEKGGTTTLEQPSSSKFASAIERNQTITVGGKPIGELVRLPGECGYVYVQCGVECKPCEEECKKECVETNGLCGYGPEYATQETLTALHTNRQLLAAATYYGDCCEGNACINGRCVPEEQCVNPGGLCGYGPNEAMPLTHLKNQAPAYYGECCEPYECVNGVCSEREECRQEGERCGVVQQGGAVGAPGSNQPVDYGECCEGLVCSSNHVCVPTTENYCTDSDGGINYNVTGTTVEYYNGIKQERTDYCAQSIGLVAYNVPILVEFYCDENGRLRNTTYQCPTGCANGACRAVTCFDSDAGENFYTAGYAEGYYNGEYGKWYDKCEKGIAIEYYCENNEVKISRQTCEYGCEGDACMRRPTRTCSDSDSGKDYYTVGTTTGYFDEVYGNYTDNCLNDYTLIEYYCSGTEVAAEQVPCPSQECSNGRCVRVGAAG